MKILLLNAPVFFNRWQNLEMPLGVAYMAAELEKAGHKVRIRDYEVEVFNEEEFAHLLKNFQPQAVGISFRSSSYLSAKTLATLVKKTDKNVQVVLGGQHASAFPEDTLRDMEADFVVRGEGEYKFLELLAALEGKSCFSGIKNLTYRYNGTVINNEAAGEIEDLDSLSFPAWHLLPIEKYVTGSILTSRGCPFSCIYCDKSVSTRKVRFRSPQNIYDEISVFEKTYRKGRLYFVDDYFFLNKKRSSELLNRMINEKLRIRWYCQGRVDGIDSEILKLAKNSGCEMIIYGVETGDKEELEYINKMATLQQAEEALRLTNRAGIKIRANFMIGFPISTRRTINNSVRFAKSLNADVYRFFIVSPLPNTVLWDRIKELHPGLAKAGWEKLDFYSASFDTIEIKKEDLVKYVMAAYFYVLKDKVLRELTLGLIWRILKLAALILRTKRIRGNLSVAFPGCTNFFLEEWFILRRINPAERLGYIKDVFRIAKLIKNHHED